MPREYPRTARINVQVQRELAEIIRDELRDPRVRGVTLTSVEVSPDMRHARIHVSVLALDGKPAEAAAALNGAAGKLRMMLKHRLSIRHIPELRFHGDVTAASADHVNRLIRDARAADERHHADDEPEPEK
ncbi:MAG TPA: 30S ribosome-binding factor RbfA [Verrucomicrobiae bacterium]|nr:30S ribosome-binding factor RbfA [Verrucomicrobiae bacterium]